MKVDIIKEINRGGFGRVQEVRLDDGSIVARKVFDPIFPIKTDKDKQKFLKRFCREVKIQSSFRSEAIIPILEFNLECDSPWFLMPLADKNFAVQIQEVRLSGQAPKQALADILNALETLHELDYVHRDLKPENILLHEGTWKLTDFGFVLPPPGITTKLTSTDSAWGTMAYCAPEQTVEFRSATAAVDIYAFGCILHDIYGNTPRIPYKRYTTQGPIGAIIEKCTEEKPEKRFKSIRALRGALLTLISSTPNISVSTTATEWVESLSDLSDWTEEKFKEFIRYLTLCENSQDIHVLFFTLSEEKIEYLYKMNHEMWKIMSLQYCEWSEIVNFEFQYCDLLVRHLELIFTLGDTECKSSSALATARLGASHNRWYVMRSLLRMCGSSLEDRVAQRLAVEIRAAEREHDFITCARVLEKQISEYHPDIYKVLSEKM